MAGTFPRFRLYQNNGTTLVYEFEKVTDINDFQDPFTFVEHTSLRGQGSIISEGSNAPWDMNLTFILIDEDYEGLVAQINALTTTIVKNTQYVLKVDLTNSTTKDYKVKRLESFVFPLDRRKKRVTLQTVNLVLRVDSWA
jgi:hypothetical protein